MNDFGWGFEPDNTDSFQIFKWILIIIFIGFLAIYIFQETVVSRENFKNGGKIISKRIDTYGRMVKTTEYIFVVDNIRAMKEFSVNMVEYHSYKVGDIYYPYKK